MKKFNIIVLLGLIFISQMSRADATGVSLRAIRDKAAESTISMPLEGASEMLHVESTPIVTQSDIMSVRQTLEDGQSVVSLALSHGGAKKLGNFSKSHVGTRLGIVVKGKLVSATKIKERIKGRTFVLTGLEQDDASSLVKQVNDSK